MGGVLIWPQIRLVYMYDLHEEKYDVTPYLKMEEFYIFTYKKQPQPKVYNWW